MVKQWEQPTRLSKESWVGRSRTEKGPLVSQKAQLRANLWAAPQRGCWIRAAALWQNWLKLTLIWEGDAYIQRHCNVTLLPLSKKETILNGEHLNHSGATPELLSLIIKKWWLTWRFDMSVTMTTLSLRPSRHAHGGQPNPWRSLPHT